jgi:hypothetical protein
MTYRELLQALERAQELTSERERAKALYPQRGTAEEQDRASARIQQLDRLLDSEIPTG